MSTDAAGMAEKRARRKAAGLCTECESPRLEGHSVCQRHFEMRQRRLNAFDRQRKANRLCYCGAKVKPGRGRCETCLAIENKRQLARYDERRSAGKCIMCGKHRPRPGKVTCRACAAAQHESYTKARERRIQIARGKQRRGQLFRVLGDPLLQVMGA